MTTQPQQQRIAELNAQIFSIDRELKLCLLRRRQLRQARDHLQQMLTVVALQRSEEPVIVPPNSPKTLSPVIEHWDEDAM